MNTMGLVNMKRWDIFCKVIDNYGDAGVCWRLARQLANEHQQKTCLWIDDLTVLQAIVPQVNVQVDEQVVCNVTIMRWAMAMEDWPIDCADVVIEAFACRIPDFYIRKMAHKKQEPPKWLNLEYLSAEKWAAGCHLLSSPQGGLNRVFFFPGFTASTGGLLRERGLIERREVLNIKNVWCQTTGFEWRVEALRISLFGYEHMRLMEWLPCLMSSKNPVQLAVTSGQATQSFKRAWHALGLSGLDSGALSVHFLPMLAQDEYDDLLMVSDVNCVRGEDSWVRAVWAAQPFVWHIYAQDDGAHWPKLEAFIEDYTQHCRDDILAQAWGNWLRSWNGDVRHDLAQSWSALLDKWPELQQYAHAQSMRYAQTEDLAQQLMRYCGITPQK